ncbi:MAG: hypothetical protein LZ172_01635 [Thaumarchaeota archaeon]|jgi:hypothetical protein|nr:hypothetical protein [Candidatus Geocrenenecus arthurdayi]MCL7388429.1 hypothetical protein [Candidatus Geocrenenecus arthurdayi]MCL7391877.1 hypothetical protein [Candidatus Geocrenenecus arthurdayi]MCL7396834.1 hypothetical protein [Candidatus Geocrenenecus arthurdayi]MCL7401826.1 hypothetical protein [Candidatus Geocrenenecus arthurdayi]
MKFTPSFEGGEHQVLLIFGDGRKDEKLVRLVAPKFNGKSLFLCSISHPLPRRKPTGVSALEGLILIMDKGFAVKKALFYVDREHIQSFEVVKEWLKGHGFTIEKEERLGGDAVFLSLTRGYRKLSLYVALAGKVKNLDEEVGDLVERILGEEAAKKAWRYLKTAINRASQKDILISIKGLSIVIKALEQN